MLGSTEEQPFRRLQTEPMAMPMQSIHIILSIQATKVGVKSSFYYFLFGRDSNHMRIDEIRKRRLSFVTNDCRERQFCVYRIGFPCRILIFVYLEHEMSIH